VNPSCRTSATSRSAWCSCGASNLPRKVYGLTSVTVSDRRYSLCRPRPYASVKCLSPWQATSNHYNTVNSFFERPLPVYFSSQNAWRKSGVIICCYTRGFYERLQTFLAFTHP
jgi:hypothetical protein